MTEEQEHVRFKHLFWFAVFVVSFCMAFSIYIVVIDKTQIASLTTFWLSTGAAGCIGFIVGSSVSKTKAIEAKHTSNEPGSMSLNLQATTETTETNTRLPEE